MRAEKNVTTEVWENAVHMYTEAHLHIQSDVTALRLILFYSVITYVLFINKTLDPTPNIKHQRSQCREIILWHTVQLQTSNYGKSF